MRLQPHNFLLLHVTHALYVLSTLRYCSDPAAQPGMGLTPAGGYQQPTSSHTAGGAGGGFAQPPQQPAIPTYVRPVHSKYMCVTSAAVPNSSNLRMRSALPLGVVVRPLAVPPPGEREPTLINFGELFVLS